jgi:hypothetical protein
VYTAGKLSGSLAVEALLIVAAFVLLRLGGFFTAEEISFFRRMFRRGAPVPEEGPVVAEEKDR